jgi:nucleolar protein TMA23
LLVSKKVDVLGVGLDKKKSVSDQWWLRAFDQGLKSLGTGQESALAQVQKHGVHRGGLYANFVKGEQLEGSIGNSALPTPEATDGTNTPVESQEGCQIKMGIRVPPEDRLERVVGSNVDSNSHDAMMHVLQNPKDAPMGMAQMLDKKRKRAEGLEEKRARRKIEQQDKTSENDSRRRKQQSEDGAWGKGEANERERMRHINHRANLFVLEAQRQGLLPRRPGKTSETEDTLGPNVPHRKPTLEMQRVFDQVGLKGQVESKGSSGHSPNVDKYEYERMKRELKRAARAYLLGEPPFHGQTTEQNEGSKDGPKDDAERISKHEAKAARKIERKRRRKEEKKATNTLLPEREAAEKAVDAVDNAAEGKVANGNTSVATTSTSPTNRGGIPSNKGTGFESGADMINLGLNHNGEPKWIPGVGQVEQYPKNAQKRAKIIAALAIKDGIPEEDVAARMAADQIEKGKIERDKVNRYRAMQNGIDFRHDQDGPAAEKSLTSMVQTKGIDPEKLTEYRKRATEKGMKLNDYIRRREEKNAAKLAERLQTTYQTDLFETEQDDGVVFAAQPTQRGQTTSSNGSLNDATAGKPEALAFVIDTVGDPNINAKSTAPTPASRLHPSSNSTHESTTIDTTCDETYQYQTKMPVSLDPRNWEGKVVKDLPKPVREARKEWMRLREEKKQRKIEATAGAAANSAVPSKSKDERKPEAREAFVRQILAQSRHALVAGTGDEVITLEGIENIPLVKIETEKGAFTKSETDLARTVARRVLRNLKREQNATRGKGKGFKKRERAEKERKKESGISGFKDRATLDPGYRGKTRADLLA